ncbi:MAG: hypothetical protein HQ514_12635 [Rhodospirillales bacterium]|nr:hypothetical protein [Rhodospirillales bacterium]
MNNEALISPYLEKSFRTMHQVCIELAQQEGRDSPDCHDCKRRQICLMVDRNHRRLEKKKLLATAQHRN